MNPQEPIQSLRAITAGTAAAKGQDFFRSLVQHLTHNLSVRYAFVAECLPHRRARSLAFWQVDRLGANFEYDLAGTPCQQVIEGRVCFHSRDLQRLFPADTALVDLQADSYHGAPLLDSARRVIGHLTVMHDQPLAEDAWRLLVLEVFAARAGAELERMQTEARLHQALDERKALSAELAALLDVNRAIGRHLQRDQLFGALARSLRDVLPTDRFGIELPIEGDKLQGHLLVPGAEKIERTRVKVLPASNTACNWVLQHREWLVSSSREELRKRFPTTFQVMSEEGMESLCAVPLLSGERCSGVLFVMAERRSAYEGVHRRLLDQVASAAGVALDDCLAHEEVRRLRDRLAAENAYLKEEIRSDHNFHEIIGNGPALRRVLRQVEQIASADSTVLILGETGTGKELIARAIHDRSNRRGHPLVKVNCGAISEGLVESELFGHVKGAFTGAVASRDGRFKVADGGTIFLDEVGELPLATQVKLLRVLQEKEFEPIGSSRPTKVDVRVIAATNRDLAQAVANRTFRQDLFYRLNVIPIRVPPLRERQEDIPVLVRHFLRKFATGFNQSIKRVSQETMRRFVDYSWPGNVRELQNVLERAVILSQETTLNIGPELSLGHAATSSLRAPTDEEPDAPDKPPARSAEVERSLEAIERRHIESVLTQTNGLIEGERGAARVLGINPSTLRSRMSKLGIMRPAPNRRPLN